MQPITFALSTEDLSRSKLLEGSRWEGYTGLPWDHFCHCACLDLVFVHGAHPALTVLSAVPTVVLYHSWQNLVVRVISVGVSID
jgi:hypothetical protein